jgi:hypothetical protein
MRTSGLRRTIAVLVVTGIAFLASAAHAKPAGNWRIKFNHTADNDGTLVLRIAPHEGTPTDVEIKVPAKTSENAVADLASASLKATLGTKNFRIGVDDGESVIIRKRGKTKNFEVTMVSTTLTGLEVKIHPD